MHRINLRVGIINSFVPSRDGIKRIAIVRYVRNGKRSEIRLAIKNLYPIENSQRKHR